MTSPSAALGRQPLTVLELDLRQTIGGFTQVVTYRLSTHDIIPPVSLDARPVITRVRTMPTKLDIGESLGLRADITVTCRDFTNDNDVAGGPANPAVTFFRLLKARVPYMANRPARLISGYLIAGIFFPERTQHYLLQRINGPTKTEDVTIHLTDALVKTDNRKAQAPNVGTGALAAAITAIDTTAVITPAVSADDYHTSGHLRLGDSKEIIGFTRVGDQLTLQRGLRGTTPDDHDAELTIQEIIIIDDQPLAEVTLLLLEDYADIDPTLIDFTTWLAEDGQWLGAFRVSTIIWDPTGVAKFLQELTQQFPFFILYDPRVPRIDFQAIKPASLSVLADLNEREHLLEKSI